MKHQIGGMAPEKIIKRIDKYTPVVDLVARTCRDHDEPSMNAEERLVTKNAGEAMVQLAWTLSDLSRQMRTPEEPELTEDQDEQVSRLDKLIEEAIQTGRPHDGPSTPHLG